MSLESIGWMSLKNLMDVVRVDAIVSYVNVMILFMSYIKGMIVHMPWKKRKIGTWRWQKCVI